MFRNLLDALEDLINNGYDWANYQNSSTMGSNSAQAQGSKFEDFVKDILCGVRASDSHGRAKIFETHLAYQGSANYPPDAMYRGGDSGDAFEAKKTENINLSTLDLNSSHPYSHLTSDLSRLASEAKNCEVWKQRDIFYVIGNVQKTKPKGNWMWMVQGSLFAADLETYRNFEKEIKSHIEIAIKSKGLVPGETNELGRINSVDLLEITDLRVRGMWHIESPTKLFRGLSGIKESPSDGLVVHCLMRKSKWESLLLNKSQQSKNFWQNQKKNNFQLVDLTVPDPDNSKGVVDTKLIRVVVN